MMKRDEMATECSREMLVSVCDKRISFDVSADITVPEYLPEVRRVLGVSAKVQVPTKYVNGATVECNGMIDHKLLYVGVDGNLYSVSDSSEYSFNTPIEAVDGVELSNGMITLVGAYVDGSSSRLISSRKVSARTRISSKVRGYAGMSLCEEIIGNVDKDMERLVRDGENVSIATVSSELMELNEEILGFSDDVRVISADASAFVSNVKRSEGRVVADGDLLLKLLVCKETGRPEPVFRKLRFSKELEMDVDNSEYYCKVIPSVTDIAVNVEDGKIGCDLSMVLNAVIAENKVLSYTEDAYFTDRECECRRECLNTPVISTCANGNFTVSERVEKSSSGIPDGADVVDVWGNACFSDCAADNGKYIFTGQSRYCILWEKDGEYGAYEIALPVRYETDGQREGIQSFDIMADIVNARARVDGENISVDAEVAVLYDVMCADEVCVVRECRVGDETGNKKRGMIVYYPSSDESAWDVAKKYRVHASSLTTEKNYYIL